MVMAAGSVTSEPSSGPRVRIENHQAETLPPPTAATFRRQTSARRSTGRVEDMVMITTTKIASVKTTRWLM